VEVDNNHDIFSFFKSSFLVFAIMILSEEVTTYESFPFTNNSFYHFTDRNTDISNGIPFTIIVYEFSRLIFLSLYFLLLILKGMTKVPILYKNLFQNTSSSIKLHV
jgi:hypothetical protein